MTNEDKLRSVYTDKALREENRCFKKEEDLRWVSLILVSVLFFSQITIGSRWNKTHHKESGVALQRKKKSGMEASQALSLSSREVYWQVATGLQGGFNLSHF